MAKKKVSIWGDEKYELLTLLKQRRVWAALLSAFAAGAIALGKVEVAAICTVVAGSLGLHSYVKPK